PRRRRSRPRRARPRDRGVPAREAREGVDALPRDRPAGGGVLLALRQPLQRPAPADANLASAVTRTRLEALQWFGLFAGPLVFAAQHVAELFATLADCNPAGSDWAVPQHGIQLGLTATAALGVVAAEAAAFAAYRATR